MQNENKNSTIDTSNEEYAVRMIDVKKTFDGKDYVLKGLNLDVKKGSLTAIIGFSGTGKSVCLKHILGLFAPTSGQIEVLGRDLSEMSKDELTDFRQEFGVLFQSAALFDDMTVLENVCFPLTEHRRDLSHSQMEKIAKEKLKSVNLDPKHFGKLPSEISGGMQKRTGLARALALDPEILIYDEPTTGLDPILTEMVDDLIVSTHKSRPGTTSIMVSHDLYAAFRIADTVAMLDAGKVLLVGTPDDFYKSEIELVKRFVSKGIKH
jgi:phospholipid/cholesterol/gamma-HCH transport system ATP-binding protein